MRKAIALLAALTAVLIMSFAGFSGTALAENGIDDEPVQTPVQVDSGGEIASVVIDGKPPDVLAEAVEDPVSDTQMGINIIGDVPAYDWTYGCSATAAGMLFGFYDRNGYTNMYTGSTNLGIAPLSNHVWGHTTYPHVVCGEAPFIASHQGIDGRTSRGHVDDCWIDYGSTAADPYITGGWTKHADDSVADHMGTNQSAKGCSDGATRFWYYTNGDPLVDYTAVEPTARDGCHGMKLFANSRGYSVVTNFTQLILGKGSDPTKGFTFAQFCAEIDAGRPVMIHVTGHSMLGYGYNTTGSVIYIKDTWDHSSHTMTWGGSYSGLAQWGVTVIRLTPRLATNTIAFPASFDTWTVKNNPYWWNAGDQVSGTRTLSMTSVCQASMVLRLSYNSLSGAGFVHQYLTINGRYVGAWDVKPGNTVISMTFPTFISVIGPTYTFRIYETNTVGTGLGSIQPDRDKSTLTLTGGVAVTLKSDGGAAASNIMVSDPWGYHTVGRWVGFSGGGAWTAATVQVLVWGTTLPEKKEFYTFSISPAYPGPTTLPVTVVDWGGVTTKGNATIIVSTSTGARGCMVVPIVAHV